MGLFGNIKEKLSQKANEVHTCCICGKEYSGFLNGSKLVDGNHICFECHPVETKLMKQKDVKNKDFDIYRLDADEVRDNHKYRTREKDRQAKFSVTDTLLKDQFLVDKEHKWFKLKDYDEVFPLSQICSMFAITTKDDNKFDVNIALVLDNPIYSRLSIETKFKAPFLASNKEANAEMAKYLAEFHETICPEAELFYTPLERK